MYCLVVGRSDWFFTKFIAPPRPTHQMQMIYVSLQV